MCLRIKMLCILIAAFGLGSTVIAGRNARKLILRGNSNGPAIKAGNRITTLESGIPPAASLVSPSGTITTNSPTYTWNAVPEATWYYLWVNDSTGNRIKQWYTSEQAGCAAGTGTCSITQAITLAPGTACWWIQTWNESGYGPWSSYLTFFVTGNPPGKAILVSPSWKIITPTPTYSWKAVSGATWYYLWVNDSAGTKIQTWYTAEQVHCSSGSGACWVKPDRALQPGAAQFWVQTWNSNGYGPWSDGMSFEVASATGWQAVGQIGGPTQAVAVQGKYAYVGVGLRLIVLDVSNPAELKEIGATAPFPHFVEDIAVSGTLAYVAAGGSGLRIVDVSDPTRPYEVGAWESPGYAEGIAIVGKYIYLANGPYGLRVIDVENPAQPIEAGSAYPMNYAFKVVVSEKYAYVAAAGAGLLIADVSDPARPLEVSSLDTPGYSYGLAVSGSTVCVADGWEGIRIINASDPSHPAEIGSYKTPGWAFGIAISGKLAYTADAFKGLRIVDISNQASPVELGGYEVSGGHAGRVVVVGTTAYVADRNWGLRALNVSNASNPNQVGFYAPMGIADAVAVSGSHAYVAAGIYGLRIMDVSNPANPRQVSVYDTQSYATSVAVAGKYVYVATTRPPETGQGLHVVDISDPTHPIPAGFRKEQSGAYRDMAVAGSIAYLANEHGLQLIDISNPLKLTELGFVKLSESPGGEVLSAAVGVTISGTLAYIAAERTGLKIVDVSNPSNPVLIGHCRWENAFAQSVVVSGSFAYIADTLAMTVIDVSNPKSPRWLASCKSYGFEENIALAGDQVVVADGGGGVLIIDASSPSFPVLEARYNTPGYAQAVKIRGDYGYAADMDGGMAILRRPIATVIQQEGNAAYRSRPGEILIDSPSQAAVNKEFEELHQPLSVLHRGTSPVVMTNNSDLASVPAPTLFFGTRAQAGTCIVSSSADSSIGTLRWCLESSESGTKIIFDPQIFPPSKPTTILLNSQLPTLDKGNITIDGSDAGVILNGSATSAYSSGISIKSNDNVVRGLQILNFPNHGVDISGQRNVIGGDSTKGKAPLGQGNVISGNGPNGWGCGVNIAGDLANNNIIVGNHIVTDPSGTIALGSQFHGIFILGGSNNRIGGMIGGEGNVLSGNVAYGISIQGSQATQNKVIGNYIGTDASGTEALSNGDMGLGFEMGANNNLAEKNVIVTTGRNCIVINDWGSSYNTVRGNLLGTDATGKIALGGDFAAILVGMGAAFNRIGGTTPEDRNIIVRGVTFGRQGAPGNLVLGNYIGTDITGKKGLADKGSGVSLSIGSLRVFIGGMTEGERNVISGNPYGGIRIGPSVDYSFIGGNYIGTDASGTLSLPNQGVGISIEKGEANVIQANTIAYNTGNGVDISEYSRNNVRRNSIFSHTGRGIALGKGSNENLPAPVIIAAASSSITGTACPGCTVEIFSDAEDEGRIFEGTATADVSGSFIFTKAGLLTGPNITATATDRQGNTSEFSAPKRIL